MTPVVGHVIRPGIDDCLVNGAQRVLSLSIPRDAMWLIPLPRQKTSRGPGKNHMCGPKPYTLSTVSDALDRGELVMEDVPLPGVWQMTDSDYLASAPNDHQKGLRQRRLDKRDLRWKVIEPILGMKRAQDLAPVTYVLVEAIEAQAKACRVSKPTIYSWIHRYWAGRECLNSLLPNTSRCGNPGSRKKLSPHRPGRKSRLFKAGKIEREGYVLKEGDRERLAGGYSLVKPSVTVTDAYLLTMGAYWSETRQDEHGCIRHDLFAPHLRPTQAQFEYWGRQLHGSPLRRQLLGADRWSTSTLEVAGSAQDQVHSVGQMAMIDSTSTDVYLTSVTSRLKVLPPMHRTPVIDVRSTFYMGFYTGWEDPSSETSMQAILCAASDKRDIAARFGIDLAPDQWPGLLHRLYLADNGEMKSEALKEAERQFRFGIEYTKAYSGQSKNLVENQHHTDHKSLDHKLPGTTRGRQRKRGEAPPPGGALLNYWEYMHEYILGILDYNNEEVPNLAPAAMKFANVPPTRRNVFLWLRDHGLRADIGCDLTLLRAFMLPNHKAIIRRDGVHLLMDDGIRRLHGHRFFSDALTTQQPWQLTSRNNRPVKVTVKVDPANLNKIWLPTDAGLLAIPNVQAEQVLLEGLTLKDAICAIEDDDLRKDSGRPARDQHELDKLVRRRTTSSRAELQKQHEEAQLPRKQPKKVRKQSLRENRANEMAYLNHSRPPDVLEAGPIDDASVDHEVADAANSAMDIFHEADRDE